MQRWIAVAMTLGCGGALLAPSVAAASGDYAVGGGTNGFFQIGVSAHSGPNGEDPSGFVSARSRPNGGWPVPFRFGGHVTCLVVGGVNHNRASIKYRFDHADNPALEGGGIQIFIEDNGPPQNGQTVDKTAFLEPQTRFDFQPGGCLPPDLGAYTPGESGDFVVHDEP